VILEQFSADRASSTIAENFRRTPKVPSIQSVSLFSWLSLGSIRQQSAIQSSQSESEGSSLPSNQPISESMQNNQASSQLEIEDTRSCSQYPVLPSQVKGSKCSEVMSDPLKRHTACLALHFCLSL